MNDQLKTNFYNKHCFYYNWLWRYKTTSPHPPFLSLATLVKSSRFSFPPPSLQRGGAGATEVTQNKEVLDKACPTDFMTTRAFCR